MKIPGWVTNTGSGVLIEIAASGRDQADAFVAAMRSNAPEIARIAGVSMETIAATSHPAGFSIAPSEDNPDAFSLIPPDLATCTNCLCETLSPADRRYGYPFTNCTNCGPRYSIIQRTPYDRAHTTMGVFPMCPGCAAEYADPLDRRFHAEPNACPRCGPQLSGSIESCQTALAGGAILALKSVGGFQIACDAFCEVAVQTLRARKKRGNKPFAVMMRDLATIRKYCRTSPDEERLLADRAAPIVLLGLLDRPELAAGIGPGLRELGVMLPYTPMHHLLFQGALSCLVMTSANRSEEPIVISNQEAEAKLGGLADQVVSHNREIFNRVDDSVVRHHAGTRRILRRARGYAPDSIKLPRDGAEVLACGGAMKNTFCLTKGRDAILSQHIGDLDNYETLQFFEETLQNLKDVYRCNPRVIAHDLHPDYLSSLWAERQTLPKIPIQHHHAHIASCMAENDLDARVIGVAFDGTGYGPDGQVWGGEFLLCEYTGFQRVAHLRPVPLVGGDQAARDGYRMAAAYLYDALGPDYRRASLPAEILSLPLYFDHLLSKPPLTTTSCGRLFDAVASLLGICHVSTYEGEAAILLESSVCAVTEGAYGFTREPDGTIDTRPMFRQILADMRTGESSGAMAGRFHTTISAMIGAACETIRSASRVNKVCLSGGVFQNVILLDRTTGRLANMGFEVFTHALVPPHDGGLALGQAAIAAALLHREENLNHVPSHSRQDYGVPPKPRRQDGEGGFWGGDARGLSRIPARGGIGRLRDGPCRFCHQQGGRSGSRPYL